MKTFALGLIATLAFGRTVDLRVEAVDENGYQLAAGEKLEFILRECTGCGYEWKYAHDATNGAFTVDSHRVKSSINDGRVGAPAERHFEITAGNEGTGMLYTCSLPSWSNIYLTYPLLGNTSCK